ncbi:putative DNA repair protein complementing XP-A cells-like protein [Hypsibius exemplaris]|uniref:DNA repair protein complementing XP-A cells-like protein n=1 Tax=Hypsibius exemplaris TaxID=2072580 RepID=A0A1W0X1Z6_HYPEX|nr:putative DNA repair protein complementing XP-A cells-like protein [Hypsibius exemplaris]
MARNAESGTSAATDDYDDNDWEGWNYEDEGMTSQEALEERSREDELERLAGEQEAPSATQNSGSDLIGGGGGGGGGGFFQGDEDALICEECERRFEDSWLLKQFTCKVCDECRDRDGKHGLITKTDAKQEYFLKDSDFTSREPPLRCIVKKNPHNNNWGDMKLFLRCQIEDRAIEVWGSEEAVEAERDRRTEQKVKSKKRTFDKMIKELRMNARSSLGKQVRLNHTHEFEEQEEYDEERDVYSKKCKTCDHVNEYEKM